MHLLFFWYLCTMNVGENLNQNWIDKFRRSAIWAGVSVVRSARSGSPSSFCSAACKAASIGTLANSGSTSRHHDLLFRVVSLLAVYTKWVELASEHPGNNYNLAFLETAVSREPGCCLTTSVYRGPTNNDKYLAYDSHLPQLIKRGIAKCLYEHAKRLVTKPCSVISKDKIAPIFPSSL